jgi:cell division protein FtsW
MNKVLKVDKYFLWTIITLVVFGFLIFYSASTGLAIKGNLNFYSRIITQLSVGVLAGLFFMFIFSTIKIDFIKKYAFIWFALSFILCFLVFIPGLGYEHNGSRRWIDLGFFTFQPSELLKLASIIFVASWFNYNKKKIKESYFSIISISIIIFLISIALIFQKDFDTIFLISLTIIGIYFVAKAPVKHAFVLILIMFSMALSLIFYVPHIKARVFAMFDKTENGQTINYQIQQSQIAIGSGGINGKGFGKSTQKFGSLPEATSDSIFAVLSEELGFLGSSFLILLYFFFFIFGYKIAINAKTMFGSLFVFGIITLVISQSLMNISSMIGIIPITGQPLVFVSHGGTSMLITMIAMGIVLNISKDQKAKI